VRAIGGKPTSVSDLFPFQDRTITAHEPVILEFKIISLYRLETTRHVSMITITLSKKEVDTSSIGYAYCTLLSTACNDFLCQFVLTKFYGFLCHEPTSRCVK
jgi:hypothetical protein